MAQQVNITNKEFQQKYFLNVAYLQYQTYMLRPQSQLIWPYHQNQSKYSQPAYSYKFVRGEMQIPGVQDLQINKKIK